MGLSSPIPKPVCIAQHSTALNTAQHSTAQQISLSKPILLGWTLFVAGRTFLDLEMIELKANKCANLGLLLWFGTKASKCPFVVIVLTKYLSRKQHPRQFPASDCKSQSSRAFLV
ncbi:hypothetical protein THAOC_32821 [Thalassiosira oceanica]|uniref:Uncharacterized protein n=1 Tax=Thalassiosira oceanica TaxID=159749 RepID=K0R8B4_THAOC|nr:hypothetical protein THAOC_32821 [Thalassiosira oceanica]|eukprot:EJK48384.1 hypothetical protein THAOC_32821 [Thalassiosira oceanica]